MSADSPVVILFDTDGNEVTLADGYSITVDTRGIPAIGKKYTDDTATFLRLDSDGYLQINSAADADEEEKRANSFLADMRYLASDPTTYLIGIDLDNGSGNYKHTVYNKLYFNGISGTIIKSKVNSSWTVSFGIIIRIDGTDADLAIFEFGTLAAVDTSKASDHIIVVLRDGINITVSGGDFEQIAAGYVETTTAINTGIQLEDVSGDPTTPGVGDVIYRIENNFGGGTLDFHYSIGYRVE